MILLVPPSMASCPWPARSERVTVRRDCNVGSTCTRSQPPPPNSRTASSRSATSLAQRCWPSCRTWSPKNGCAARSSAGPSPRTVGNPSCASSLHGLTSRHRVHRRHVRSHRLKPNVLPDVVRRYVAARWQAGCCDDERAAGDRDARWDELGVQRAVLPAGQRAGARAARWSAFGPDRVGVGGLRRRGGTAGRRAVGRGRPAAGRGGQGTRRPVRSCC